MLIVILRSFPSNYVLPAKALRKVNVVNWLQSQGKHLVPVCGGARSAPDSRWKGRYFPHQAIRADPHKEQVQKLETHQQLKRGRSAGIKSETRRTIVTSRTHYIWADDGFKRSPVATPGTHSHVLAGVLHLHAHTSATAHAVQL